MIRKTDFEFGEYVATAVGMALACSGYAMLGQLSCAVDAAALLLSISVAAGLCLVIAGSIAELSSMYPAAPGIRTYLRVAFGDWFSLSVTFALLLMVAAFAGVETHAFHVALREVIPFVPAPVSTTLVLALVVGVNLAGVEWPLRVQLALTCFVVLVLAVVSGLALSIPATTPAGLVIGGGAPFSAQLALAIGGAVFLFTGFEWVAPLGKGPAAYRRRIPWSMPVALVVLLLLFALFAWARVRHLPAGLTTGSEAPHVSLGVLTLGRPGAYLMVVASVLSVVTTFNAGLMGTSRLIYALGREKCLPPLAVKISLATGAPVGAVSIVGAACWLAAMCEEIFQVQLAASLACASVYCSVYAAYVGANARLRKVRPDVERPFRSRVPVAVQVVVAALLFAFGVSVLFAEPAVAALSVVLMVVMVGSALVASSVVVSTRGIGEGRAVTVSRSRGDVR